ncbi:MAG: penicillin-binding protein 2 [Kiritimatiellae bacterium]|nr:penicillin-binding protein 2 [Kiritimatiellia bacterium]
MEELSAFLASGRLHGVLAFFRWAFFAFVPLLVLRVCFHFAPYRIGRRVRLMLFPLLFCAASLAILAYQSTWQLFGFTRPDFVQFTERFNPREDNAANHLIRGSILDRNGQVLAYTEPDGSGRRVYPWEEAAAHVAGYRHPTGGLTGIEGAADAELSGYRALETAADFKDALRTAMRRDRHVGTNVAITVDATLQAAALSLFGDRTGAAAALDPRTGEILLLFSSPSFDPNVFERRLMADPRSPMLNRALHGSYPPGSTFKTAIAALMAQTGVPQVLPCPAEGYLPPGARRPIRDHEYYAYERRGLAWPGFGTLDLDAALAKSSNSYFARGGVLAGPEAFNAMAEKLHFNDRLVLYSNGLERISIRPGNVPRLGRAEKRELAQLSIGQGRLLAAPVHMAMLAAAIANGGVLMRPHLALGEEPEVLDRPFSAAAARRVRRAMRHAVRIGTAKKADIPGLDVCGKTGTAQNPHGEDHAWFVCFAPADAPRIAIAVVVENAGFGSTAALPVAVGLLRQFFGLPDE